jgi:hypothetical protein
MDSSTKKFWEHEFGSSEVGYDFAGREVRKGAYDQKGSRFGWNKDEILPRSKGGGKDVNNRQVTHIETNTARGNGLTFWLDGVIIRGKPYQVRYQVKQTSRLTDADKKRVADYHSHYAGKTYCILIDKVVEPGFKSSVVATSPENVRYTISNILYDGTDWVAIISERKPCTDRVIIDAVFPKDDIQKSWDEGFRISNAAYGAGQWVIVLKKGNDWHGRQTYYTPNKWPDAEIKELCKEYTLTEFVCGDSGNMLLVGSQFITYGKQHIVFGQEWPPDDMKSMWHNGYAITRVLAANGFEKPFVAVMSQGGPNEQKWWISDKWPGNVPDNGGDSNLKQLWDEGYRITDLASVNDDYILVGSKNCGIDYQCYRFDKKFPLDAVRKLWNGDTE